MLSKVEDTAILRLAAPLMGIAVATVLPVYWSVVIALSTAAVCLHAASARQLGFLSARLLRYTGVVVAVAGHCAYFGAICLVWHALDHISSLDIGYVLFTLVLILLSFTAWLMCAFVRGAWAVITCWGIFISIATAMAVLNLCYVGASV